MSSPCLNGSIKSIALGRSRELLYFLQAQFARELSRRPGRERWASPSQSFWTTGWSAKAKATRAALAARAHWLTPERLPKYAPELDDIEREWKTLKAHRLAHKTFHDRDSLKAAIDADVKSNNSHRKTQVLAKQRISA
jgi:transposase